MAPDARVVAATERWFLERGLPHFIAGYNASHDIWTRAVPVLSGIFLLELLLAFKVGWPWWLDLLALVGAVALAFGVLALTNRARGRPLSARPDEVGPWEVSIFVVVPALVPVVFGTQYAQAVSIAATNTFLLLLVYATTSYGLVPMTRWGLGLLWRQVGSVVSLFVRALPLLILVLALLLFTSEVWFAVAELNVTRITLVVLLFVVIGASFALARVPQQISELSTFESWDRAKERCHDTPMGQVVDAMTPPDEPAPPLSKRQWSNVGLVVLVSEAVQVLLVTLLVFGFFVVFGVIALHQSVQYEFVGRRLEVIERWNISGDTYSLSEELLKVAVFLAAFSGLYFVVVLLTDKTYRDEFLEQVVSEVREAFAVRAAYLAYIRHE
jgi:hypothetical protein